MATKRLKIEDLQDINIRELTEEEAASLQGGMLVADERYNPYYPKPDYPKPDYPPTKPPIIRPFPCTNYPTKDGKLPWCAVIL